MAATGHEHQRHGVAALQVGDAGADFLDDAGGLVAQRHGHRPRPVAIDDGQVGMAQAGRGNPDQHFVRAGAGEIDGLDGDRAGLRIRAAVVPSG